MAEKPLQDLISRLERERLEADRRYNEALTALDAASQALGAGAPAAGVDPAAYDASLLPRVNEQWKVLANMPAGTFGLPAVRTVLERQEQFNAAIVEHLNRNVAAHEQAASAIANVRASLDQDHAARARFLTALILYAQTITEYVDAKDRALGGPELREQIVLANERAMAASRAVDRLSASGSRPETTAAGQASVSADSREPKADFSYVGFEDRFRGSQDEIRARLIDYIPILSGTTDGFVLDVGCGRGELLALLKEAGVRARGIDVNGEMVALCRERGFEADQADALSHLQALPDASLSGLVAIQVVEHLEPAYLTRFLETAFHKLRPGAPIILETINPACWMAFFEAYIRDLTHAQPIHPDTLRFLVQASGFSAVDVQFRAPVSDADRLDRIDVADVPSHAPVALRDTIAAVNAHADKLNARLFSYMDYAVVARR